MSHTTSRQIDNDKYINKALPADTDMPAPTLN